MKHLSEQPRAGSPIASRPWAFSRLAVNIASAISLCLSIAVVVLWLRSYDHCDVIIHQHGPADRVGMTSEFGVLVFEVEAKQTHPIAPGWVYFEKRLPRRWRRPSIMLGFDVYYEKVRHFMLLPATPVWGLTVPHLFAGLLTGALPARWLLRRKRFLLAQNRTVAGLCPACGYDLRASAARCPECGTASPRLLEPSTETSLGTPIS